jgi:hypothetical protein
MTEHNAGGPKGRPNRNQLWLIGVAAAAVIIAVLAMNSTPHGQVGSQVYRSSADSAPAGQAAPGG